MRAQVPVLLLCLAASFAGRSYGQKPGEFKVDVLGISIGKPVPKTSGEDSGDFGAFAVQPGTRLTLWLSDPSRQIVDLDEKASKITAFTDDKQTDLMKKETKKGAFGGFSFGFGPLSANISPDKHHCTVEVRADHRPAAGATTLRLKADLVLKCGANEKVAETKNVSLAKGSKLAGGPLTFTIDDVDQGFGEAKTSLALETEGDIAAIKEIAFFDADGKEIKSRRMGWSSSGFGAKMTHVVHYGLEKKVDKATTKITYFDKIEAVTVPIDLKTGIGF
jgi:hypothetical protein